MEPTTVVALRSMEMIGYVTLRKLPENRKNVYVFLTPLGRRLKKVLIPLAEEVNAVALKGLSEAQIETTRKALLTMVANLSLDCVDDDD